VQKPLRYILWAGVVFGAPALADYALGNFDSDSDTIWAVNRIEATAQSMHVAMPENEARHWIAYVKSHSSFNTKQSGALIADVLKYPSLSSGSMQARLDMTIIFMEEMSKVTSSPKKLHD
jgi:hypothetical protein